MDRGRSLPLLSPTPTSWLALSPALTSPECEDQGDRPGQLSMHPEGLLSICPPSKACWELSWPPAESNEGSLLLHLVWFSPGTAFFSPLFYVTPSLVFLTNPRGQDGRARPLSHRVGDYCVGFWDLTCGLNLGLYGYGSRF